MLNNSVFKQDRRKEKEINRLYPPPFSLDNIIAQDKEGMGPFVKGEMHKGANY